LAVTVIIHIQNSEPIVGEMDDLPNPTDNLVILNHPRTIDGKDIRNISEETATIIWPIDKIMFIEIQTSKEEEEIIGFVRE
jgi:hypothetical protein